MEGSRQLAVGLVGLWLSRGWLEVWTREPREVLEVGTKP